MFAWRPLNRAASWSAPSPGVQETPQPGPRESDRSPTPSTMGYQHTDGAAPTDPFASLPTPTILQHPHGFSTTANASLLRPETKSDSLIPSDPRHDRGYLQRMRDFFSAALERLGNEEK